MTPAFASAPGQQQSTANTTPRSDFLEFEWRSVDLACAEAASSSSIRATRGGHVENGPQSPKSPDCNYTTTQSKVRINAQEELRTSLATLSVVSSAATSPYARRLSLLDTDSGAAASESETDDFEDITDEAFASYRARASAGRKYSVSRGSRRCPAVTGDERSKTSSTAAVSNFSISNQFGYTWLTPSYRRQSVGWRVTGSEIHEGLTRHLLGSLIR